MLDRIYEAEELILAMAYIVEEKRRLEDENEELKEKVKWFNKDLDERYRKSQENASEIMKLVVARCTTK